MTPRLAIFCGALLGLAGNGGATPARAQSSSLPPTPVAGEARMVTFAYDEDRIYKVLIRPKNTTQLKFGAGETVTYVSAGDKSEFVVTVPSSRAFVEVKARRGAGFGGPVEAVNWRKQRELGRSARVWVDRHGRSTDAYRFDVVGVLVEGDRVRVRHVANAFSLANSA